MLDGAASVGVAICLVVMSGWNWYENAALDSFRSMFVELDSTELPIYSSIVWRLASFKVLSAISVVLLLAGFWILATVKDRLRANVYGLVVVFLLASLAIAVRIACWIPLSKVIQAVGA